MQKFYLFPMFFLAFQITSFTQSPDLLWFKTYGGAFDDLGNEVIETSDGDYVMVGTYTDLVSQIADLHIIKTNSDGDVVWEKTYGSSFFDGGYAIEETTDKGFIISGFYNGTGATWSWLWLVRTDMEGDTLWTKLIGPEFRTNIGQDIHQTSDGGFIIAGITRTFGIGTGQFYIIKTNSSGDIIWSKKYGAGRSEAFGIEETFDGGYIAIGENSRVGPSGAGNVWLMKMNNLGDSLWTRNYGDTGYDGGTGVKQTPDSGFVFTGEMNVGSNSKFFVSKTDVDGNLLWNNFYNFSAYEANGLYISLTQDSGIIATGWTSETDGALVIKLNQDGDTIWTKSIANPGGSIYGTSIIQTSDMNYLLSGRSTYLSSGGFDFFLAKIDEDKITPISFIPNDADKPVLFQNSPNPFNSQTSINYYLPNQSGISLQVSDMNGKIQQTLFRGRQIAGHHQMNFSKGNLPSGSYFIILKSDSGILTRRMLILEN